ncbi:ABC transporter permease [Clostridium sp. 'deep sea']|uniref:ABC transporter permease n=1 Tax=Clostridium sp. 'deep sea' TaxID=2779445 RepID=UPI0018964471|nr:ABC transporter permease [Clostridium sp. 'deep sea']QOR35063.1 ABC transporter permease [Clostridium sp. 'deep sea']
MKSLAFASRNRKEILRDPLTIIIGMGLPVILLVLLSIMQKSIPNNLYNIEKLAPGIAVFSFSFISLFTGMLIAKDRSSSFLMRVFASPLTAQEYILGYTIPVLPIALLQIIICFTTAFFFGLNFALSVIAASLVLMLISLLYIGFGLLFGVVLTDKQVGGFFAIFVNITTWLSGTWFELSLVGGMFKKIAYTLPFAHAVDAVKYTLAGNYNQILTPMLWVAVYTVVVFVLAIAIFNKRLKA